MKWTTIIIALALSGCAGVPQAQLRCNHYGLYNPLATDYNVCVLIESLKAQHETQAQD